MVYLILIIFITKAPSLTETNISIITSILPIYTLYSSVIVLFFKWHLLEVSGFGLQISQIFFNQLLNGQTAILEIGQ